MIKKLESNFEIIKETLNTLPKNTEKNKEKYLAFANESLNKYRSDLEKVLIEIKKRYSVLSNVPENNEIAKQLEEVLAFEQKEYLNPYKTAYSMMEFDRLLYDIEHFYKTNLDQVNEDILKCLKKFEEVGVKKIEFDYSPYASEYIDILKTETDKEVIHQKFEKIYWKCSDVILHIELNIRSIFFKNKKMIEKHFQKQVQEYLNGLPLKEVVKKHRADKGKLENLVNSEKRMLLDKFISGKLDIKSYKNIDLNSLYEKFRSEEIASDKLNDNILKLSYSLTEFKGYLEFQYLVEDIKLKYQEKDKYKGQYESKYKEVMSLEKKLKKLNSKGLFKKKNDKTTLLKINTSISELELKYKELEELSFNNLILSLTDDKTLYDALLIVISDYNYLIDVLKRNNIDVGLADKIINDINKLIYYPHLTILNNITLTEEKDIPFLISDRYVLYSLNIDPESLKDIDSINVLLDDCYKILILNNLSKMDFSIEDIEFIIQAKKIIG